MNPPEPESNQAKFERAVMYVFLAGIAAAVAAGVVALWRWVL